MIMDVTLTIKNNEYKQMTRAFRRTGVANRHDLEA
jgi:hypothetical protein